MQELLHLLADELAEFYNGIRDISITPEVSADEIRYHLTQQYGDFTDPVSNKDLLADVGRMLRHWNLQVTHPRYFGLFNPSVLPVSIVGDALAAAYNPQLAVWSHAPAANEIERHTLRYFAIRLGLDPDTTMATFTTGGTEANQSAVLVALTHSLPGYPRQGLTGVSRPPVLYASSECHHSFEKIAHIVGLGRDAVRYIPVDTALRIRPDSLLEQVDIDRRAGFLPLLIVATAGTTSAGIVDPLPELADICSDEDLWLHVDAAWGGAACLSPLLRRCLMGIERADSITWDAHKWLSVPMGAGMFFCAHPQTVQSTFEITTPYMPQRIEDTTDLYRTSIQWSRRNIGLKVFMSLAALGADGYREIIEHQALMGDLLREELTRHGWRSVNETSLPVVCFTHSAIEDGLISSKQVVDRLLQKNLWVSEVRLADRSPVLRACITSYRTQSDDIKALAMTATAVVN